MFGFMGQILRVDLKDRKVSTEELSESDAKGFLGGRGLSINILYRELKPGIDPLGPENKLVYAVSPITATRIPGDPRIVVAGKSPATGIWCDANLGGYFAHELKKAGYDALIVEGASDKPVYIWIKDDVVEIRDAEHLWGKWTADVEKIIREEVGDEKAAVTSIGPAGENLVKFAAVIHSHRAAGRGGMGAVMGSKKLKAIAARGTGEVKVANPEKVKEIRRTVTSRILANEITQGLKEDGQIGFVSYASIDGILPTMNFRRATFEGADKISGQTMTETILIDRNTCAACPVSCKRIVEVKDGPYAPVLPEYGGPEYENAAALGSLLLIDDLEAVSRSNMLCNALGLDTISTGVCIAFAMECYEKGLITKEDADGLELTWGNADAAIKMVEKIAYRDGFGSLLAEGVKRASEKIGKNSEKFAMHIKGLEVPMHEPRGKKGLGLIYAVSNRGACHLQSMHDPSLEASNIAPSIGLTAPIGRLDTSRKKVEAIRKTQQYATLINSLGLCLAYYYFGGPYYKPTELAEMFQAVTGWNYGVDDLMLIAERIDNLCRCFNVREGITRRDDYLPPRFAEPLPDGRFKGQRITEEELENMLNDYYELSGWDKETGIPTKEKLVELGLEFVEI